MTLNSSSFDKAFNYSIRILSQKDYSIFKMKEKLQKKNFESGHIDEVIDKLLESKYLKEEEYTDGKIKLLLQKGFSNNYILQKLEQEQLQITDEKIEIIREAINLPLDTQILNLIKQKLDINKIPNEYEDRMKLKNKIMTFMASKGYDYYEVQDQLSKYIE